MQPVGPGCCESAPVAGSRCSTATASTFLAAAYTVAPSGEIASASAPRNARPSRHAPGASPPRTQAALPPSWSKAPPTGSIAKEATAFASCPATYRLCPSGEIARAVAPARPVPEAQPPPPPGRTHPAAPRSCVSAPLVTSRANAVTDPEMDDTA